MRRDSDTFSTLIRSRRSLVRRRINSVQVRGSNGALRSQRLNDSPVRRSFNKGGTIHVATARVLLRDISKILFPDNPVNVPVIK